MEDNGEDEIEWEPHRHTRKRNRQKRKTKLKFTEFFLPRNVWTFEMTKDKTTLTQPCGSQRTTEDGGKRRGRSRRRRRKVGSNLTPKFSFFPKMNQRRRWREGERNSSKELAILSAVGREMRKESSARNWWHDYEQSQAAVDYRVSGAFLSFVCLFGIPFLVLVWCV